MPLKAVLDRLEDAPETVREFYRETDGKWRLQLEAATDDTPLGAPGQRALDQERRQRMDAVRAREDAIRARDEQATKLAELQAELTELKHAGTPAGQDDVKAQLAKHKDEYDRRTAQLEKLINEEKSKREAAEKTVREGKLIDMLREARKVVGIADTAEVDFLNRAKPLYRENTETGTFEPFENGQPLYGFDEPTKLRTAEEVAREILKAAPHLRATSSGGGAAGSMPTGMNGTLRVSRSDMKDPAKYAQIKAQAEKTGATVEIADNR